MRSRSPCPPRARAGFTLVELLVTLAVASLLLAIVSGVMGSARAAAAAEDRAVEPWRALDLAAELLAEELGLAGFEPVGTGPARFRFREKHKIRDLGAELFRPDAF